jgi:hypothetical protein
MGVSGVGEGLAATKFCTMFAIVEESKPCKKDSRMSPLLMPKVRVVRLWLVVGVEMAVLIAELGWRPPYWMGDIKVWLTGLAVLLSAWEYGTTFEVATDADHAKSLASEAAGRERSENEAKSHRKPPHLSLWPSWKNVADPPAYASFAQRCS